MRDVLGWGSVAAEMGTVRAGDWGPYIAISIRVSFRVIRVLFWATDQLVMGLY